jgi:hypothetical protein
VGSWFLGWYYWFLFRSLSLCHLLRLLLGMGGFGGRGRLLGLGELVWFGVCFGRLFLVLLLVSFDGSKLLLREKQKKAQTLGGLGGVN